MKREEELKRLVEGAKQRRDAIADKVLKDPEVQAYMSKARDRMRAGDNPRKAKKAG